jgi:Fe-S-cluster-containing hydrogenase component 2
MSLKKGKWVKFISGASNQDLPHISSLSYLYTLANVDCIDISADAAVVRAALDGINSAYFSARKPWVMVSVNDGEDLHFRKAFFDGSKCPTDCPRPCKRICPALAIGKHFGTAVDDSKCYGCGRCVSVCPLGLITTNSHQISTEGIRMLLSLDQIDAIEIHSQLLSIDGFDKLWKEIGDVVLKHVKALAISFPNRNEDTIPMLGSIQKIISSTYPELYQNFNGVQIWQTDGRPMSGDLGKGTVHASVAIAKNLIGSSSTRTMLKNYGIDFDSDRHFIQLAGGVNDYSPIVSEREGLTNLPGFGGFAFGGFARKKLLQYFETENIHSLNYLQQHIQEGNTFPIDFVHSVVNSVKVDSPVASSLS